MEYTKKLSDLPSGKCLATVKNRPWFMQLMIFLVGILIIIVANGWWKLAGLGFIALVVASFLAAEEYITCKVYADCLAIYNPKNQEEIEIIPLEKIIQFRQDSKSNAFVQLILKDETVEEGVPIIIATFQAAKLRNRLCRLMPEKDYERQRLDTVKKFLSRSDKKKKNKKRKGDAIETPESTEPK